MDFPGHDIVVIGASAGGVQALAELIVQLPQDLSATLFIVLHRPSAGRVVKILERVDLRWVTTFSLLSQITFPHP